jgi:DNA-binding MarR family transcriptional regulator
LTSIAVPTRKDTEKLANLYNNRQIEAPVTSKEAPVTTGEVIELGPSTEKLQGDMLKVYQTWSVQGLTSIRSIADATGIGRTKVNELLNQLNALGYIER